MSKRRLPCSSITVFENFHRQKIVASEGLLNVVTKSTPRTNGWKLNPDKFKFKIRHMILSMKVTEYWNKWLKKGLSLHSLTSLNQAGLSLNTTCFRKNHKLCFCQTGLYPEVKEKFMTRHLDGVREDNLMSFSVLPSMNLLIYWMSKEKKCSDWFLPSG